MGVLSSRQLSQLVRETDIVKPLPEQLEEGPLHLSWEDRVNHVEGTCFELSLDRVLIKRESSRMPFIGVTSRMTPEYYDLKCDKGWWILTPGRYELMTMETINCPWDLDATLYARRTLVTAGAELHLCAVCPGYSGRLTVGATVEDNYWFSIERGALFMSIKFDSIPDTQGVNHYAGIWAGDKVTTDGAERSR